jgi:poly-gamma-glutamate synthesis protein (capsule biosynthesis protein)
MTGRGVDQILPRPAPPRLHEPVVRSALEYVALAEQKNGVIPRKANFSYVWGAALEVLDRRQPAARIVNLETSVTTSNDAAAKGINYRMHPTNVPVLTAARIDCAVLANNHVLDWGHAGLRETLDTLAGAGIRAAGAGRTSAEAQAPAAVSLSGGARLLVFAAGADDSGVPQSWSAGSASPGVHRLPDYSSRTAERFAKLVEGSKRAGDIALASLHWGGNWGYEIPAVHRRFAHDLIEYASIDVVHGHSSHHAKAIEVHLGRPIFYGCGDLLNDYEGIPGHDEFRDDLVFMYFVGFDAGRGEATRLEMVPRRIRNFRLGGPEPADVHWLHAIVSRECGRFKHRVVRTDDGFALEWS